MTPLRLAAAVGERFGESALDWQKPGNSARAKALVVRRDKRFAVLQAVGS